MANTSFNTRVENAISSSTSIVVGGSLTYGNAVTQTISANTNNFNPTGIQSTVLLRLNVTSLSNLTGIIQPTGGAAKELYLFNVGTANLILQTNDGDSDANNRFLFTLDITLQPDEGLVLVYDSVSLRWRSPARNN